MSNAPYPIIPTPIRKSWTDRHPRWKILLGALAVVGLLVFFVGSLLGVIEFSFKQSDVYHIALAAAQENPKVIERIGQPIHAEYFVLGTIKTYGSDGDAIMTIPITGSRGAGKIHLLAKKRAGSWSFRQLAVETGAGAESINLLAPETESP